MRYSYDDTCGYVPQKSGVEFLPNPIGGSYGDKNRGQIKSIIDSLLQNERCRRAFEIVGLQTINQTVENGVVIGPATLLSNPANNGMLGIVEGARRAYNNEFGTSSARGATINKIPGQPKPLFKSTRPKATNVLQHLCVQWGPIIASTRYCSRVYSCRRSGSDIELVRTRLVKL